MMSLHREHLFFQRITFVKKEDIEESCTYTFVYNNCKLKFSNNKTFLFCHDQLRYDIEYNECFNIDLLYASARNTKRASATDGFSQGKNYTETLVVHNTSSQSIYQN